MKQTMNIQREFFTISTLSGADFKAPTESQSETPFFYRSPRPMQDKPVYTVSLDDVLNEYLQDEEFRANFADANKQLAETYYKDEKSLRAMRLKKGLTQSQLAEAISTSQPQITKLENGDTDFRSATVVKLAKFFGIKASEMFGILIGESHEA